MIKAKGRFFGTGCNSRLDRQGELDDNAVIQNNSPSKGYKAIIHKLSRCPDFQGFVSC
jgi:hypothetical protein